MTKNAALTAEYAGEKTFAALRKERLFAERLRPLVFVAAFVCVFYLALAASIKGIEWTVPIDVLLGQASKASEVIFYNVRLPRTATAAVVGAALALAGAVMQNVLRNPLASASTLGVSQGAAFGAALAITFFHAGIGTDGNLGAALTVTSPAVVTVFAFVFGVASGAVILALSLVTRISSATMILSGIALGAMFTGGTAIIQYFADDIKVASIVYWTFGDLGRTGWTQIGAMVAALAVLCVLLPQCLELQRACQRHLYGKESGRSGERRSDRRNACLVPSEFPCGGLCRNDRICGAHCAASCPPLYGKQP